MVGKTKKGKAGKGFSGMTKSRYSPYGRDTTRITDLCDMLSSSISKIKSAPTMEDVEETSGPIAGDVEEDRGSDNEGAEGKATRGKIQQRHKREWKELRAQLEDMKAHKKAMGSATLEKKTNKKTLAKEIKRMTEEMTERHKKELDEFDQQEKDQKDNQMEEEARQAPKKARIGAIAASGDAMND